MPKANIWGIWIDDPSIPEILKFVDQTIAQKKAGYIATINSELLQLSLNNPSFRAALQAASLKICDGVGVQWAAAFLANEYPTIINIIRAPLSLLRLLIQPASASRVITHRTAGRLLFEDLLISAETKGHSVYFLGGGNSVAHAVAQKAKTLHPQLKISGYFAGQPEQLQEILSSIEPSNILFVAYGSPRQEIFIHNNLNQLKSNIIIGLGGTFDAYVGSKPIGSAFRQIAPPRWINHLGLESIWRLITQPNRFKRVMRSTLGLIIRAVFNSPAK
jgi:N-acetylglucosaminyldiphosphoundecaprenol N-acetyl-beta-D-mannosaminyltransferase